MRAGAVELTDADEQYARLRASPPFTTAEDGTVVRSKAARGYPYRIVYTVEPDAIPILAYAHERREPGYRLHCLNN